MISVSMPAMSADYECALIPDEFYLPEEPELHEDNPEANDTYFGYNYLAKYRLPKLNLFIFPRGEEDEDKYTQLKDFTVSWDFTFPSDHLKLKEITSDASGDIFIVSGFLPDSADTYTERFLVSAKVTSISDDRYKSYAIGTEISFDTDELEIKVERDDGHTSATSADFARYLVYDSSNINLHEVGPDYSITVTMSKDYDDLLQSYSRYIKSSNEYTVNIPEWLTWTITGEQTEFNSVELEEQFSEEKAITSIVIKFNDNYEGKLLGDLKDGTTARINVPLISRDDPDASDISLSWDITYRKPPAFTVTSGKTFSVELRPGSTDIHRAEYTGSNPVSITSSDSPAGVKFIVGHTDIDASGKGTITITVEASGSANDGEYKKDFTFTDAYGNSDKLTATVTVKRPPAFTISSGKTLTFTLHPGSTDIATAEYTGSNPTRITSSDSPSGVKFTVGRKNIDASGKGTITVTAEALNTATAGDYEKTFTFTDTYGRSDTITAKATIVIPPTPVITITGEPKTFSLKAGNSASTTLTATGDVRGAVTWTVGTVSPAADVRVSATSGSASSVVSIVVGDSVSAGTYSVNVTAKDFSGTSASTTLRITITAPSITITGEPKTFSLKAGEAVSTTLTATGDVSGAVTWTVGNVSPTADIRVSTTSGSASSTISISTGQNVAEGTYSIEISARDSAGTSASTTLRITITEPLSPEPPEQDTDLTNRIAITDEDGAKVSSRPFSSLKAGATALYTVSLEGTGITAKSWRLIVNGADVDSAMYAAADSWARIVTSDATSATIEADPPENLGNDSTISLAVTGNDGKEYTADLGTVKKADSSSSNITGIKGSSGSCNFGAGAIMLAVSGLFIGGKFRRK